MFIWFQDDTSCLSSFKLNLRAALFKFRPLQYQIMKLLTKSSAAEHWAVDVRAPCDSLTWTTSTNRTGATPVATFYYAVPLVSPISKTILTFMSE